MMATTTRSRKTAPAASADIVPQAPQSTPPAIGGGGDYSPFVWQQLGEIQKTLGAIDAKLDQHKETAAKLAEDLGKVKADVAEFKQIRHTAKVLATVVAVVMAGVLAATGFIAKEVWSVLKPMAVQQVKSAPPGATKVP